MRDHRTLEVFQLADELVLKVYRATRKFPREELYGLVSQLRRSAVSVPTNIVDGYGRESDADRNRFLDIAFSSNRELGYLIGLTLRLGYLDSDLATELESMQGRIAAALAALKRSYKSAKTKGRTK